MTKVIKFKNKHEKAKEWILEVIKNSFDDVENCLIFMKDKNGEYSIAKYNSGWEELSEFQSQMQVYLIHSYLRDNINNYIQYIENE